MLRFQWKHRKWSHSKTLQEQHQPTLRQHERKHLFLHLPALESENNGKMEISNVVISMFQLLIAINTL